MNQAMTVSISCRPPSSTVITNPSSGFPGNRLETATKTRRKSGGALLCGERRHLVRSLLPLLFARALSCEQRAQERQGILRLQSLSALRSGRAAESPPGGLCRCANHLASAQLREMMGTDLFVYHGFTEFYLEGKWVMPLRFNKELCLKHKVALWNSTPRGFHLSTLQSRGKEVHGIRGVPWLLFGHPVARIVKAWEEAYGATG